MPPGGAIRRDGPPIPNGLDEESGHGCAVSGHVTGLAVDPSDPSRAGELFRFNLDLLVERADGDPGGPGDTFVFKLPADDQGGTSFLGGYADGFTGGVYVAGNDADLPHFDSALPAVQFEALMDDFANAVMAGDDFSYSNSFTCIPASVP